MARLPNPYIFGPPLTSDVGFYGREGILRSVCESLARPFQKVIVLRGPRRIGKTSFLHQLPRYLPPEFHAVYFNLEGRAQQRLDEVLYWLARTIAKSLDLPLPQRASFEGDIDYFQDRFLPQVYKALGERRLLLLLDEFDVLDVKALMEDAAVKTFFPYLRELIGSEEQLAFAFVVGRNFKDLSTSFYATFKSAPYKRISFLEREEAKQLITEPAKDVLNYDDAAVDRIIFLTAGQPYLTQLICYELFNCLQRRGETQVSVADVDAVIGKVIETGTGGLAWIWEGLPRAERFILSAMAHIAGEGGIVTIEEIRDALQRHGVRLMGMELTNAPEMLVEGEMLERPKRDSYRFIVELLRRWIAEAHPLEEAIRELERVSPRAVVFYEAARSAHSKADLDTAIADYRRALAANPNHAKAQLGLAQALYEQGKLAEAIAEFEKAYQFDEASARDGLVEARLAFGESLEREHKVKEAISQYECALKLAPEDEGIKGRLVDALIEQGEAYLDADDFDGALRVYQRALEVRPEDEELRERTTAVERQRQQHIEVAWKRETIKRGRIEEQLKEERRRRGLAEERAGQAVLYVNRIVWPVTIGLALLTLWPAAAIVVKVLALLSLFYIHYFGYKRLFWDRLARQWALIISDIAPEVYSWLLRVHLVAPKVIGSLEIKGPAGESDAVNLTNMWQEAITLGRAADIILDKDPSLRDAEAKIKAKVENDGKVTWWLRRMNESAVESEMQLYDDISFRIGSYRITYLNPKAKSMSE